MLDLLARERLGAHLGHVDAGGVDRVRRVAVDDEEREALGARLHGGDDGIGQPVSLREALGGLARPRARRELQRERELDHAVSVAIAVRAPSLRRQSRVHNNLLAR